MTMKFPQLSRSGQDDHNGTCKKVIGARFTSGTVRVVVFVVWDSLTTATVGLEPRDDD